MTKSLVTKQELFIATVLDKFDFDKVYQVMVAMNWRWMYKGEMLIPVAVRIREHAKKMLNQVVKHHMNSEDDFIEHRSGGLVARKHKTEWGECLTLAFEVERKSSDPL